MEVICVIFENCVLSRWLDALQAFNVQAKESLPAIVRNNGANRVSSLVVNAAASIVGVEIEQDVGRVVIARMANPDRSD